MTTTATQRQRGLLLSLLTLLTLAAATLVSQVDVSASTSVAAETRVRAIDTPTPVLVAANTTGSPQAVGVSGDRLRHFVSATGVATNSAGDTVRHYTTSEAAQSIMKGGEITPGSSGKIWVTPDEYLDGVTARQRLALGKTPDGYFEIPVCRVNCPSAPSPVAPWNGQPGGGIEITTNSPIDVTGLQFRPFGPR